MGGVLNSNPVCSYDIVHSLVTSILLRFFISIASKQDAGLVIAGYGRVVLEKILVFAKLNAKQQSSQLFVLSGRQDDAVISQYGVHTLTLSVLKSKKPFRVTMVGITFDVTIYLLSKHACKECPFMDWKNSTQQLQRLWDALNEKWDNSRPWYFNILLQGLLTDLHPAFGHSWALFGSLCVGVDGPPCSAQLSASNDQWS